MKYSLQATSRMRRTCGEWDKTCCLMEKEGEGRKEGIGKIQEKGSTGIRRKRKDSFCGNEGEGSRKSCKNGEKKRAKLGTVGGGVFTKVQKWGISEKEKRQAQ